MVQISEDARALCKYSGLSVHALVGGMDYRKQQEKLHREWVDILVATPGRLLDFCGNQDVHLDQIEVLVIDEADRMLDMGFIPQVRRIVRMAPRSSHRQTLLFSATFSPEILDMAKQWMHEPVKVEIEAESVATDRVTQHVYLVSTEEKYTLLYNILKQEGIETLIAFANRRDECRRLHERLREHGFRAGILSGDVDQGKRIKTLDAFKAGQLQVLVATDVAGRGIHIDDVSHVINFTLPEEPEDYVHRIGRTGRAGNKGISISFACEDDAFRLPAIETLLGRPIVCEQPPADLLAQEPPPQWAWKTPPHGGKGAGRPGHSRPSARRPVTGAPAAAKRRHPDLHFAKGTFTLASRHETILVVEDSPMVMKIIKHVMGQNPITRLCSPSALPRHKTASQIGSDFIRSGGGPKPTRRPGRGNRRLLPQPQNSHRCTHRQLRCNTAGEITGQRRGGLRHQRGPLFLRVCQQFIGALN